MRLPFLPRPSRDDLAVTPLHAIVRDFPETLEEFLAHGVSLEDLGDRTVEELEDFDLLLDDLEASTAWRPRMGRA